jgi:glycosyltransferase involved in cell wall biosynthesis
MSYGANELNNICPSNCRLTIIVPVYNGADFIERCIESILKQSFKDYECLLLDDGSTDDSLSILSKYSARDARFKVISGENVGVARVRNKGIDVASGEYIVFIDQDDYIEPDFCDVHLRYAAAHGCDVVISGYRRPDGGGKTRKTIRPSFGEFYKYTVMAAWAKIHRTEFLRGNNIRFFENKMGEDIVFTLAEIKYSNKIHTIDYIGYNWYYNEASVSNTAFKTLANNYDTIINLLERCRSYATDDPYYEYYLLREIVFRVLSCGRYDTRFDFLFYTEKLFDWFVEAQPGFEKNKYILQFPKGESSQFTSIAVKIFICLRNTKLLPLFARLYCKGRSVD